MRCSDMKFVESDVLCGSLILVWAVWCGLSGVDPSWLTMIIVLIIVWGPAKIVFERLWK